MTASLKFLCFSRINTGMAFRVDADTAFCIDTNIPFRVDTDTAFRI